MRNAAVMHKLNAQMNSEFYASNLYLQMSDWCAAQRLNSSAVFLRYKAQRNVTRMMRVFEYMKHAGEMPVVGMSELPHSTCSTLADIYEQMEQECERRMITLSGLTAEVESEDDQETLAFLRELEKMQQEEGLMVHTLLEVVRKAHDAGMGMEQTDSSLLNLLNIRTH